MQLVSNQELAWVISYQPVIVSMVSMAALLPSYPLGERASGEFDSKRVAIHDLKICPAASPSMIRQEDIDCIEMC